ncbi:MAG: acyl-CoA thioesterase II [Proteobacteria bacterium]|nr:acyl-CoA thioesterase II [Pseudomonadota bacterium]
MKPRVAELVSLLRLERLERNLFRGISGEVGSRAVFGGQVLGQAVMAAGATVDEGRALHSLHAYFLRPGDKRAPIVYDVDRIRDGGSFTTRRVVAIQHGEAIFNFAASFHAQEPGPEHAATMPAVPPPDALPDLAQLRRLRPNHEAETIRVPLYDDMAIEIRPVQVFDPFHPDPHEPKAAWWMRVADRLPDDPLLHQALLAYASDFGFVRTAMLPHALTFYQPQVQCVSLDHAMWFHAPVRFDEWVLHDTDSPVARAGRGLVRGSLYAADGRIVASTAQEGLIRLRRP